MSDSSTERVLARYLLSPARYRTKTAAFPPFPPNDEGGGSDLTSAGKRNIPKDHEFQAKALKPLSKALWASTVALGHALTAYRHLSRLKSTTVSPDGMMGGRGYVMKLADMRQKLYEASEALSAISDTMFDEINAPHWKPKLAQLDESDQEDVTRFVEEAQEVMEDPEGEAEDEIDEIEAKSKEKKPKKKDSEFGVEENSSSIPSGDASQAESQIHHESNPRTKEASYKQRPAGMGDKAWVMMFYTDPDRPGYVAPQKLSAEEMTQAIYVKTANSSINVSELGGPRVDHIGPGNGNGEYGDFSEAETMVPPPDDWDADGAGLARRDDSGEDYDYTSQWENETAHAAAEWKDSTTSIPDSNTDDTPTEGLDFGIGYGARGEGTNDYANPSGEGDGTKGVWGPASGVPGAPPQSSGDSTGLELDMNLNRHAYEELYGVGKLPQDVAGDVARSDYYPGTKDNEVSVGSSEVPSVDDQRSVSGQPLLNTYYTLDDTETPYERYDYTTHTLREPGGNFPGQDHQEPFAPDGEGTR